MGRLRPFLVVCAPHLSVAELVPGLRAKTRRPGRTATYGVVDLTELSEDSFGEALSRRIAPSSNFFAPGHRPVLCPRAVTVKRTGVLFA
jgi:hypothetical protein